MYIEFGLDGLIAYESTCEHKHESISRFGYNFTPGQRRKRGRPLNNTAALIMQPNEAYTQAASSIARRRNSSSSSTESSLGSPKHKKT